MKAPRENNIKHAESKGKKNINQILSKELPLQMEPSVPEPANSLVDQSLQPESTMQGSFDNIILSQKDDSVLEVVNT